MYRVLCDSRPPRLVCQFSSQLGPLLNIGVDPRLEGLSGTLEVVLRLRHVGPAVRCLPDLLLSACDELDCVSPFPSVVRGYDRPFEEVLALPNFTHSEGFFRRLKDLCGFGDVAASLPRIVDLLPRGVDALLQLLDLS